MVIGFGIAPAEETTNPFIYSFDALYEEIEEDGGSDEYISSYEFFEHCSIGELEWWGKGRGISASVKVRELIGYETEAIRTVDDAEIPETQKSFPSNIPFRP